jgi:signal peptidase II
MTSQVECPIHFSTGSGTNRGGLVIHFLAFGGISLLVDQWSKRLVDVRLANRCVSWGRVLRIRRVRNPSNMCLRTGARAVLVLIWLAALASVIILYRAGVIFHSHAALIGLGSAFGGAAGNLLDISRRRPVLDFIDVRWWPVFNLADVGIIGGIVLAFWARS